MERPHHVEAGSLEAALLQMINDHNRAAVELRERTGKITELVLDLWCRIWRFSIFISVTGRSVCACLCWKWNFPANFGLNLQVKLLFSGNLLLNLDMELLISKVNVIDFDVGLIFLLMLEIGKCCLISELEVRVAVSF